MTRKILTLLYLMAMIAPAASFAQPEYRQSEQAQTGYGQRANGQPEHGGPPPHAQPGNGHAEPNPGPHYYHPPTPPQGWNARPQIVDRNVYQHNFQAARIFHIGPYDPPAGFAWRHWGYGEILPRAYWTAEYRIADYWLFALEVPPAGFEWVRCGPDALLLNIATGEILQAQYGVFG